MERESGSTYGASFQKINMPWPLGRYALIGSLFVAHVWGTVLLFAVWHGKDSPIIAQMFDSISWMIFTTLAVLVGGKAWKEFAPMKWSGK